MSGKKDKELRRLSQKVSELEKTREPLLSSGDLIGLCIGVAVAVITSIAKPDTPTALIVALIALFGALVYPSWHLSGRLFGKYKDIGHVSALVLLLFGVAAFGWLYWPGATPYSLSEARSLEFSERLTEPTPHDRLRLGCVEWSAESCVMAGKVLLLFSKAGWPVDRDVARMNPSIPVEGVSLVSLPNNFDIKELDKLPPHLGMWNKSSRSHATIGFAFRHLGIPVSTSAQADLPQGVIGVYFGPEPKMLYPITKEELEREQPFRSTFGFK